MTMDINAKELIFFLINFKNMEMSLRLKQVADMVHEKRIADIEMSLW